MAHKPRSIKNIVAFVNTTMLIFFIGQDHKTPLEE